MNKQRTILLVLRSGGDFTFEDVQLIARHINGKWQSEIRPRIICLWDKASGHYEIDGFEVMPLSDKYPGTWSRIQLYSPEMEQYRPYLYIDLDTAVIQSLEKIIDLVKDESKFIALEDFWQKKHLATGLVWFPANCEKLTQVWKKFRGAKGRRMDHFLRQVITPDLFWQDLTNTIYDFKPRSRKLLNSIPHEASIICFHGKPRISQVIGLDWVNNYVNAREFFHGLVTVIIPYKEDRGWLQDAINSIPNGVQLLLGQGNGNWPANFNKMLPGAKGKFIRYLHEDDMLSENCIRDSLRAFETGVDFIHGNAEEFYSFKADRHVFVPKIKSPTLADMLVKNHIHSATLMYRREIFEKLGGFDERLNTAEEYEFSLRCLKAGYKLGYCPAVLAHYRRHPLQKVRVVPKVEKTNEREMVRKRYRA